MNGRQHRRQFQKAVRPKDLKATDTDVVFPRQLFDVRLPTHGIEAFPDRHRGDVIRHFQFTPDAPSLVHRCREICKIATEPNRDRAALSLTVPATDVRIRHQIEMHLEYGAAILHQWSIVITEIRFDDRCRLVSTTSRAIIVLKFDDAHGLRQTLKMM